MSGRGRSKKEGGGERGGRGGRIKRQEVEADDGWTVITHGVAKMGLSNNSTGSSKNKKNTKSGLQVAGQMPTNTVEGLTVSKLLSEFKNLQEKWEDSALCKQIKEILRTEGLKGTGKVKEAVCIGIGSFSLDWSNRWRSMWQLVLFHSVVYQLSKPEGTKGSVKVYAQDPAFTDLDVDFLKSLDITALTTGIEDKTTKESFVFSPFVDWYLLLPMFLKNKDPRLYVGNEILDDYGAYAGTEEKRAKLEECNKLGKEFLEEREEGKQKLKEFEGHAHAFGGMVVYTKSASPSPEPEPDTTEEDALSKTTEFEPPT